MDPELKDGAYILRNPHGRRDETDRTCDICEKFKKACDGQPTDVIILLYFEDGQCGRFITADGEKSEELSHAECVKAIEDYGLLDFIPAEEIMKEHKENAPGASYTMPMRMERIREDEEKEGKMFRPDLYKMRN